LKKKRQRGAEDIAAKNFHTMLMLHKYLSPKICLYGMADKEGGILKRKLR
jgi:hypothetical protein